MNPHDGAVKVTHNLLRQTTSFVGREQEMLEIIQRLNNPLCRLLTFVGPGGIGKTRLAVEVANRIGPMYRDGVYFVPLQPLRSAAHIPSAIAHSLGLVIRDGDNPLQQTLNYLCNRQSLLLLDNFEHLVEGADFITQILVDAPDVRLLATSREPLNLHEEWQWVVGGLHFPSDEADEADEPYSAVRLFAERAAQIKPEFALDHHCPEVTRICQLVEGIPLAIELAANWTKSLTCAAIADAIQHNIDFLTSREQNIPERHRSMRAVYNHSWRLLFEEERRMFERLSVFRGDFTREAAEQVEGASLETLASLVDKSFIRQDAAGRYDIHELLRQYGAEQLAKSDGIAAAADRHMAYYADFVRRYEPELKGQKQLNALNMIEADFENIRAAWTHAVAQCEFGLIDQMIEPLMWFGETRSFSGDVRHLFEVAAAAFEPITDSVPHSVWARLAVRIRQSADIDIIDRALAIAQNGGNQAEVAYCMMQRGVYDTEHRHPQAFDELKSALAIYRSIGDDFGAAVTYLNINYYQGFFCDQETIMKELDLALQQARKLGNPYHMYKVLFRRAWTYASNGQYEVSQHDFIEALNIANQNGFRELAASCIGSLGVLAFFRGEFDQAKRMASQNLEGVMQLTDVGEQGFARMSQANIANVEGNYAEALQLAEEALVLVRPNLMRERSVARAMAIAYYGLGNFEKARERAYWSMAEELSPGIRMWNLPVFALLLAHDGAAEHAAELLGLIFTHPASPIGWFENWPLMNDLRAQLSQQLGVDAYTAAWQHGTDLDLDSVVNELLLMTDEQARQPLDEPLTDRELEVLRLVADGLSNHEMAELLTVGEGTIRTHVYNLSQKLGVRNRTSAVARARALHILR